MKKIFTGYREMEYELWDRVIRWAEEHKNSLSNDQYLNEEEVVIIEVHKEEA